jgi:hypothetical protein
MHTSLFLPTNEYCGNNPLPLSQFTAHNDKLISTRFHLIHHSSLRTYFHLTVNIVKKSVLKFVSAPKNWCRSVRYLITVFQLMRSWTIDWGQKVNCVRWCEKIRERKVSWHISVYYLGIRYAGLYKTTKTSVRLSNPEDEIRIGYFPNKNRYRLSSVCWFVPQDSNSSSS